jgi:TATA-binding protein-associated factor Taf7
MMPGGGGLTSTRVDAPIAGAFCVLTHPELETQLVIRFPLDIARRLSGSTDRASHGDFSIIFSDDHHVTIQIFDETLDGVLVSLPTLSETYRRLLAGAVALGAPS